MLRGAGKRGGRLIRRVAEEFLLLLKLGGGVLYPILNLKGLKSIRILAAYSSIGPQTENQAWGKKRCVKSLADSLVTQVDICGAKWPSGSHRPESNVLHILFKMYHFSYKIIPNSPSSIMVLYCVFPLPSPAHPGVATRFA